MNDLHPTSRRTLIAGNWKMNGDLEKVHQFAKSIAATPHDALSTEIALFPPTPLIHAAHAALGEHYAIGAQDCHWQQSGAFTGETSPALLQQLGCSYVLIGHSERRHLMGETDEYVHDKLAAALACGLTPVLCIGETLEQYQASETYITLASQLYHGLPKNALDHNIIIAYEPVWAIGTGKTPKTKEIQHCHDHIRTFLCTHWTPEKGEATQILYGGSVRENNCAEILGLKDIDGLLVGGASLDIASFQTIIAQAG